MDYPILNKMPDVAQAVVIHNVDGNGNAIPVGANGSSAMPAKGSVTLTGVSQTLVAASATRSVVRVSNPASNGAAAIDPSGGTCALDAGIPLNAGDTIAITGKEAQQAMTCIGTGGQKLTVYAG